MRSKLTALKLFWDEHQFACFIAMCVVVSVVMTLISLEVYKRSGAIKLDMSRPGYEKVRTKVEKSSDDQPYDSSGKLDQKSVDDFEKRINKYQNELKKLGNYDSAIIDDENLDLVEPTNSTTQAAGE